MININLINLVPFNSGIFFTKRSKSKKQKKLSDIYFSSLEKNIIDNGFSLKKCKLVQKEENETSFYVDDLLLYFSPNGSASITYIINANDHELPIHKKTQHDNSLTASYLKRNSQFNLLDWKQDETKLEDDVISKVHKLIRLVRKHSENKLFNKQLLLPKKNRPKNFSLNDDLSIEYVYTIYDLESKEWEPDELNILLGHGLKGSENIELWETISKGLIGHTEDSNNWVKGAESEYILSWSAGSIIEKKFNPKLSVQDLFERGDKFLMMQCYIQSNWNFSYLINKRFTEQMYDIDLNNLHKLREAIGAIILYIKNGKSAMSSSEEKKLQEFSLKTADMESLLKEAENVLSIRIREKTYVVDMKKARNMSAKLFILQLFTAISAWSAIGKYIGFSTTYNAISIPVLLTVIMVLTLIEYRTLIKGVT